MPNQDKLQTVITPVSGEPITLEGLPPADTSRWVARRKAQVVAAVETGFLTVEEACRRYKLTLEEYLGWQRALYRFGLKGLQVSGGKFRDLAGEREPKQKAWARRRPSHLAAGHA